jgi:hypothetical protein
MSLPGRVLSRECLPRACGDNAAAVTHAARSWDTVAPEITLSSQIERGGVGNRGGQNARDTNLVGCAHAVVRLRTAESRAWWACEACGTPFSPATFPVEAIDAAQPLEYLSIRQLAGRIPYSEGAIRNMMSRGVFRFGVHFTKPNGGRPVFHWPAVQEWARSHPDTRRRVS